MTRAEGAAGLHIDGEDSARLDGVLDFTTVAQLYRRTGELFRGQGPLVIDASGVEWANSAGVGLLLEWLAEAHARGRPLRFSGLPEHLLAVARLSGVDDLLTGEGFDRRRDEREARLADAL